MAEKGAPKNQGTIALTTPPSIPPARLAG